MTNKLDEKKKDLFENWPVLKAIFSLAVPSIVGQLILVIYNLTDTFFIGLASGQLGELSDALVGGVTICMPVYMMITAISNLFGIGAASVISRSLGKNNPRRAKNSSRFAFWGCLFVTAFYCLLVLAVQKPLAMFMASNHPQIAAFAQQYLLYCVVIFGIPTSLNTLFSHLIRAQGKSLHASIGIAIGGILNCALDPLFMFVLFDIKDAAIAAALATGIANTIALLYYAILFIKQRKTLVISLKFSKMAFKERIPVEVLKIGTPAFLMTMCENISYLILDNLVGVVSLEAIKPAVVSGVGIAKKVNMFAHSVVRGMTQGVLPLIGYNKSNGNRKRMAKVVYASGGISLGVAATCTLVSILFGKYLTGIFTPSEHAVEMATKFLLILSIGAPFSAIAYTAISFFQAVGKAWRSLILALLRKGILDIPMMYIFSAIALSGKYDFGADLIVWATPIADFICAVTAVILFVVYLKRNGQNKMIEQPKEINNEDVQVPVTNK